MDSILPVIKYIDPITYVDLYDTAKEVIGKYLNDIIKNIYETSSKEEYIE